ncbi:MAG: hypothetical protein QM820_47300 [Minicystis sp.]
MIRIEGALHDARGRAHVEAVGEEDVARLEGRDEDLAADALVEGDAVLDLDARELQLQERGHGEGAAPLVARDDDVPDPVLGGDAREIVVTAERHGARGHALAVTREDAGEAQARELAFGDERDARAGERAAAEDDGRAAEAVAALDALPRGAPRRQDDCSGAEGGREGALAGRGADGDEVEEHPQGRRRDEEGAREGAEEGAAAQGPRAVEAVIVHRGLRDRADEQGPEHVVVPERARPPERQARGGDAEQRQQARFHEPHDRASRRPEELEHRLPLGRSAAPGARRAGQQGVRGGRLVTSLPIAALPTTGARKVLAERSFQDG